MLTLLAYEKWGPGCFDLLKGEIAVAIHDGLSNSIFLFRSLCGTRPLFYVTKRNEIVWSSELDDLVVKSGIDPIVNDAYAIGYAYGQPDVDKSPFLQVKTVPPGIYIEFKDKAEINISASTWHPERISTLQLASDEEYEEAWRQEVRSAIKSKLRTKDPLFCELSGGLDSTTLVLMSDQILQNMGHDVRQLTTTSFTFETSRTCDESYFIRIVEAAKGRDGIHISEAVQQPTFGLNDITFTGAPNAHRFVPGRYRAIADAMRAAGARVLLTGIGGDHLFWSDQGGSPELADLLVSLHPWTLFKQAREWTRASRTPLWQELLSFALAPLGAAGGLDRWLQCDILRCPWITKKVQEWVLQRNRDQAMAVPRSIGLPSRRVRETLIRDFRALLSAGYFQGQHQIYFSHPYSNQQLIEFVLALPMNQLVRPGQDRSLMRRATRGLIPEAIRARKSKGTIDEVACRVLQRERGQIAEVKEFEVCRREYADPVALAETIPAISMGRCDHSYALLRLLNLEQWLQSLRNVTGRNGARPKQSSPFLPNQVTNSPVIPSVIGQ